MGNTLSKRKGQQNSHPNRKWSIRWPAEKETIQFISTQTYYTKCVSYKLCRFFHIFLIHTQIR